MTKTSSHKKGVILIEEKTLYIPANVRKEKEIADGFGKKELFYTLILCGLGCVIGIIVAILYQEITLFIVPPVFITAIGISSFQKNVVTNQSFLDICRLFFQFQQSQKEYSYKYYNLYEQEKEG